MAPSSSSPGAGAGAGVGVSPILPKPASGLIIASDFESKSHDELYAMVEHADVERTTLVAARLSSAAALLALLGDELKGHVSRVRWEGEAGEAFRVWGADMANATLRLGELSGSAGEWMAHAASTLSRVKSAMPKPSEARATLDAYRQANPERVGQVPSPLVTDQSGGLRTPGPTQRQAYEAQQAPAEAARLMRQLAESYAWSAHQLSVAPRPTFRPMPKEFLPPVAGERHSVTVEPGAGGGGQQAGAGGTSRVVGQPESYETVPHSSGAGASSSLPADGYPQRPVGHASTEIDGGVAAPPEPLISVEPPTANAGVGGGDVGSSQPYYIVPPSTSGNQRGAGRLSPRGDLPTSTAIGPTSGRTSPRVPGMADRDIVGGRSMPRPTGRPTSGIPRGTVIGTEPVPGQTRPPAGHPPTAGGTGAVPSSSRPGEGSTRRFASEPGGVVGGRPARRPSSANDQPFTPGGTGLVRGSSPGNGPPAAPGPHGGMVPTPGGQSVAPQRNRREQRPVYVVEEEGAWSQGKRRVVPPVIE